MKTKLFIILSVFVFPWVSMNAEAVFIGCPSTVVASCTNMSAMRSCSAMLTCAGAGPTISGVSRPDVYSSGTRWRVYTVGTANSNVTGCSPTYSIEYGPSPMFMLTAMAATSAPGTRRCVWQWNSFYAGPDRVQALGGRKTRSRIEGTGQIRLDSASGLPVELMEFSLE